MTRARDLASGSGIEAGEVLPHIIPGVLYPAVAGKDLSGTALGGSYTYGTAHTDGRSYYYTDIKGSKPIKDPRIGAHFGSQRHMVDSIQELEQETAINGKKVYSIDGREWVRIVGTATGNVTLNNSSVSSQIYINNTTVFIEITGYFNNINVSHICENTRMFRYSLDGATEVATDYGNAGGDSPLISRYVECGSFFNIPLSTTLGIHTIKLRANKADMTFNAFELIAQDTSSTANKSKIQIPSQNVVSYGKKFTVSGTPHYDPFNGFVNDTTLFSSVVDVETSLGLGTATTWGAPWDKGSDDHIRPFNGGRVVKWVDSSGTIKTSVTMMPANAQNVGTTASNEITTASATNSHTINFSDDVIDHSLSEVAKTYLWQEFGNGAANGGTGSGSYADASMLASGAADDIAYVMDDGLTSLSGTLVYDYATTTEDLFPSATDKWLYVTFIGTGISFYDEVDEVWEPLAQNLPYGTHIMSFKRHSSIESSPIYIDGVQIKTEWFRFKEFAFHQPKKPPIPEDAVVLADYMLMADFVPQATAGIQYLSKGTRMCSISRDVFANETDGDTWTLGQNVAYETGWWLYTSGTADSDTSFKLRMPAFATNYSVRGYKMEEDAKLFIGDTDKDSASTRNNDTHGSWSYLTNNEVIGVQNWGVNAVSGQQMYISAFEFATPIHTSSHYQTFETPYLHELVGGDRNMEQHNLIVTPDGKSWDEVTRDTSYIGSKVFEATTDTNYAWADVVIFDTHRGSGSYGADFHNKDFAIAYDRHICLRDGQYRIHIQTSCPTSGDHNLAVQYNTTGTSSSDFLIYMIQGGATVTRLEGERTINMKRGDYLRIIGMWGQDAEPENHHQYSISRV